MGKGGFWFPRQWPSGGLLRARYQHPFWSVQDSFLALTTRHPHVYISIARDILPVLLLSWFRCREDR
jgi:hypothetical protein